MTTGVEQELAGLAKQNGATIGRLLANGNIGRAEEGPDGRMHARIRIPTDELVWDPAVLVMPHGGTLELTLINDDFMWVEKAQQQFDAVLFFESFHHCWEFERLLTGLHRVLRPGGKIFFGAEPISHPESVIGGMKSKSNVRPAKMEIVPPKPLAVAMSSCPS